MSWKSPKSHEQAWQGVRGAWQRDTFPQSVLFTGPAGCGKRALMLHLAALLSCTAVREQRPCANCFACKSLRDPEGGRHWLMALDLNAEEYKKELTRQQRTGELVGSILSNPYGVDTWSTKATISVAQVRHLRESLSYCAEEVRVILVPEADRMNENAANAFLKTLEEVPVRTYFLLSSSRPAKLLATIRSRCLSVALAPLQPQEIREILMENGHQEAEVDAVLPFAQGSVGLAQNHLSKGFVNLVELALRFLEDSLEGKQADLFEILQSEKQVSDATTATLFLEALSYLVSDFLKLNTGGSGTLMLARQSQLRDFFGDSVRSAALFRLLADCNAMIGVCTPTHCLQWLSLQIKLSWGEAA